MSFIFFLLLLEFCVLILFPYIKINGAFLIIHEYLFTWLQRNYLSQVNISQSS